MRNPSRHWKVERLPLQPQKSAGGAAAIRPLRPRRHHERADASFRLPSFAPEDDRLAPASPATDRGAPG
jgi:hypothetical protein